MDYPYVCCVCDVCVRPGAVCARRPDGRFECASCDSRDHRRASGAALRVLGALHVGCDGVEVTMGCSTETMRRVSGSPMARGWCSSVTTTMGTCAGTVSRTTLSKVYVHADLTEADAACVAVHELVHAWINAHGLRDLIGERHLEAICDLAALAMAADLLARTGQRATRGQRVSGALGVRGAVERVRSVERAARGRSPFADALEDALTH